jgi:hypothetical protein
VTREWVAVAELVDALALEASGETRRGSSPLGRTTGVVCAGGRRTGRETRGGRGLGPVTCLLLKRAAASRPSGEWSDDDYDVVADGIVVGRIFKVHAAPVGLSCLALS